MLMIRLARVGKKRHPSFRVVVQEKQKSPSSNVLEILGHYNPLTDPATFEVKADRLRVWMDRGAQTSNTLNNLLINKGLVTGQKRKVGGKKKQETPDESAAAPKAEAPASPAAETPKAEAPAEEAPKAEEKPSA